MKTPEEMAEEYAEDNDECEFARDAFLAGYNAGVASSHEQIKSLQKLVRECQESIKEWDETVEFLRKNMGAYIKEMKNENT